MTLDIEGVLAGHRLVGFTVCRCGEVVGDPMTGDESAWEAGHRAHVAAVLREQIAAWLESDPAVSVAAESISDAWLDDGHGLACEYRDRPHDVTSEASAHAVLAALAAQVTCVDPSRSESGSADPEVRQSSDRTSSPSRVPGEGS